MQAHNAAYRSDWNAVTGKLINSPLQRRIVVDCKQGTKIEQRSYP